MKRLFILGILSVMFYSCNLFKGSTPSLKLIPYKAGDKWGYVDRQGKIVINPQFNFASVFMGGMGLVKASDDKWGYIGEDGKYKVNAIYKSASPYSEGLACVVPENGKPQFIDESGEVKFTVNEGQYCGIFSEGLAAIKTGEKWGYIDKSGEVKINSQFDYALPFSEGLAAVGNTNKEKGETLWGFINTKGEIVINQQFKEWGKLQFCEGLCLVSDGKKYGYINKEGKYVVNPQFDVATKFKNGLAIFRQGSMVGFIDKEGKIVINPQFNDASFFSSDVATVKSSDGKYGYIDKNGKYIINPQFEKATDFFDDIAFVRSADKWGIINKEGKYVVNPQFDYMNIDLETYMFETVESDYFDVAGIADKFLEGTDQLKFRNLSGSSTIAEIKTTYPDVSVSEYDWSGYSNNKIILNDNAYISGTRFTFLQSPVLEQKPIYRTVSAPTYWDKNATRQELDRYEIIPNDKANLGSVTFTLYLANYKATNKSQQIYKAITDELIAKAGLSVTSPSLYENSSMEINMNTNSNSYATYQVTYRDKTSASSPAK